jgi:hypothetical protein
VLSSEVPPSIFDPSKPLMKPPELHRSKVQVPLAVVDFFDADVFLGEHMADVDPSLLPPDPPTAPGAMLSRRG